MSRFFLDRPVFAWVIAIAMMLLGAMAIYQLPVSQYPPIAPPSISISASYPGADELGRGRGYEDPHGQPNHIGSQELLPDMLVGQRFYHPDEAEAGLRERLAEIRRARGRKA